MPWETQGDGVSFSGQLADLMAVIMTAYDQDAESKKCDVSAGVYVTASAIVLREILLETLEADDDTSEFLEFISDAMKQDDEGNVEIATFALLDQIAEHISPEALEGWIASPAAREAIIDLAMSAFPVE
jgi:hypothetical protein